jgi:hypothetical protein
VKALCEAVRALAEVQNLAHVMQDGAWEEDLGRAIESVGGGGEAGAEAGESGGNPVSEVAEHLLRVRQEEGVPVQTLGIWTVKW